MRGGQSMVELRGSDDTAYIHKTFARDVTAALMFARRAAGGGGILHQNNAHKSN